MNRPTRRRPPSRPSSRTVGPHPRRLPSRDRSNHRVMADDRPNCQRKRQGIISTPDAHPAKSVDDKTTQNESLKATKQSGMMDTAIDFDTSQRVIINQRQS